MSAKSYTIPFNRPALTGKEMQYMAEAVRNGHISGDGVFAGHCHAFLVKEVGVIRALLTTSCTHALEMAALLLDIQPGDEVIVPSFTFVSTINAFVLRGARPVFVDIRPDTLNLDEKQLPELITERTRTVIAVHYAGVGCEMDAILEATGKKGIPVIEDNAHGLFGAYRNRPLGSWGVLAAQSFHETKNFTCGEGGALLINDPAYVERAEILREKGTNRSRFFRGQIDKYSWVDVGSSYLPSDMLAAFLWAQLEKKDVIQNRRRTIWHTYHEQLSDWARQRGVRLPIVPEHCEQAYHMFYMLMPSLDVRQALIAHLKERGILSVFHYQPLHLSEMGRKFGGVPGQCPVTEKVSDHLVRLPFFFNLDPKQQDSIIQAIRSFIL